MSETTEFRAISIASRAILPVMQGLEKLGLDRVALQAALGPDAALTLDDPDARFSYLAVRAFWDEAVRLSGDPAIGLHVAEVLSPGDYGVIWYLAQASESSKDAVDVFKRFRRLLADSVEFDLEESADGMLVIHRVGVGLPIPRAAADYVLGTFTILGRRLMGDDLPLRETFFSHPDPGDQTDYQRIFHVPVRFGAAHNALRFTAGDRPLPHPDHQLRAVLERHAEILLEQIPEPENLVDRVRHAIALRLPENKVDVERIGQAVESSGRTLRRRLKEEGVSFRELVAEVRRDLALRYLDKGRLSVGEIAFLLGFSEASAFHRAFRRWTGQTPVEHRRSRSQD